jgi:hypothetical protein
MAALILSVSLGLAAAHWLLKPLTAVLAPLVELQLLPWLLLVLVLWLLAGQRGPQA